MNNQQNQSNETVCSTNRQQRAAQITLSVSAIIMLALIAIQSIGLPVSTATAGMVSKTGNYTALTAIGRTKSAEMLLVIDDRNEDLLVYNAEQGRDIELVARESLPDLFTNARAQSLGQRP